MHMMNQKITLIKKVHNITTNNNNNCDVCPNRSKIVGEKNHKKKELSSFHQVLFWITSQPIKTTKNTTLCNITTRSMTIITCYLLKRTTIETTIDVSLFSSTK